MAKMGISQEQLSESIRQVGGLGALKEQGGVRRDNPFGASYIRGAGGGPATHPATPEADAAPLPRSGSVSSSTSHPIVRSVLIPAPDTALEEEGMEKVTVLMTPSMRDAVNLLARKLQRRRTRKAFRFTANTVFRAAIQKMLDTFHLESTDRVNSEAELLALLKSRKEQTP